ncbi:hypothetical protein Tco_1194196 [Tanacetum coccineum]
MSFIDNPEFIAFYGVRYSQPYRLLLSSRPYMLVIWNPSIGKSVGIVVPRLLVECTVSLGYMQITTPAFGVCPSTYDLTIVIMSYLETKDTGTDKTNEVETLYQSLKAHALASKVKSLPQQYTTVQELFKDVSSSKDSNPKEGDKVVDQSVEKPSFASVVHDKPSKKLVKIKEMRSEETVNGAAVALPIEAVEAVNA